MSTGNGHHRRLGKLERFSVEGGVMTEAEADRRLGDIEKWLHWQDHMLDDPRPNEPNPVPALTSFAAVDVELKACFEALGEEWVEPEPFDPTTMPKPWETKTGSWSTG